MSPHVFTLEGITFEVTKKKMKNMRMRILQNMHVAVSVPNGCTYQKAQEFVQNNMDWVRKSIRKAQQQKSSSPNYLYASDVTHIYNLGKELPVIHVNSDDCRMILQDDGLYLYANEDVSYENFVRALKEIHRKEFERILPELISECERVAHVRPYEWRIKDMRTRWGSCNVNARRIWLRLGLAAYPKECIKAVMIHELTHLYEPSHNEKFYRLMNEFYPQNAEPNMILRKNLYTLY
ncbi:MAG: M48 family metallopeptidase [Clostridia bacterium]|nr:M48 family metallopeptidase [Clostridia bacterium]